MPEMKFAGRGAFAVREEVRYYLLVVLISLAVFKVMMQIHEPHFDSLVHLNHGVIERWPHWLAHQNRLLGPYAILLISKVGISYEAALRIFMLVMTVLQTVVMFALLQKIKVPLARALGHVILFSFLFLCVQHFWIHSWDNIDLVIFTLFAFGILKAFSPAYFVGLFAIALLNRESALFISFYLIIDAFSYFDESRRWRLRLVSWRKFFLGIALTLAGIAYIRFIRMYLFDHRRPVSPSVMGAQAALGNHIPFTSNLVDLFIRNLHSIDVINSVFIIGSVVYLAFYCRRYSAEEFKAFLVYLVLVANILIFGLVNETRMLIVLLPFLIFMQVAIERIRSEAAALHPPVL